MMSHAKQMKGSVAPTPSAQAGPPASDETLLEKARLSGDPFRDGPYYETAERSMDWQWTHLIWPLIQDLDFAVVIDLAAGHGRNSERLRQHTKDLILVDINQECLDFCQQRFKHATGIRYCKTDGASLRGIEDNTTTLIYTFDAMVHFDSDVVRQYLREFRRVLKPGGHCFCHHSNLTENPGEDFTRSQGWRNFMSKNLFAHYALKEGLAVVKQQVIDWSAPQMDCLSLLQKPASAAEC